MLSLISSKKFREWKVYEEIEPFPDERADWNSAHIVQFLWALSGDPNKKYPRGRPLTDFTLPFGDLPGPEPIVQTVEYQEMLIDSWIFGSNAAFAAKGMN